MSAEPPVLIDIPELGWPLSCGGCSGGAGTCAGGCSGTCSGGCSCGDGPNPLSVNVQAAVEWTSGPCAADAQPSYAAPGAADPLAWVAARVAQLRQFVTDALQLTTPYAGQVGRGCRFSGSHGNLVVQWQPPAASSFFPVPVFTYDNLATGNIAPGWNMTFNRSVQTGPPVAVLSGTGTVNHHSSPNPVTGYCTPSDFWARNSLQQLPPSGQWQETQADGVAFRYSPTGSLLYISNPAGGRWTVTSFAGRIINVTDPFNGVNNFTYDAAGKLGQVIDAAGRRTSLAYDGLNNLSTLTGPDGVRTTLVYAGAPSSYLTTWTTPVGSTNFTYAGSALNHVIAHTGQPTIFLPLASGWWIADPRGFRTSLAYSGTGQLLSVRAPNGGLTTYTWSGSRVSNVQDPAGHNTAFVHTTLADGSQRLRRATFPAVGSVTFLYDGGGRVRSVTDTLARRWTLVWDAAGNRKAVIDPLGQRTSYAYLSTAQLAAVQNPLAARTTYLYTLDTKTAEINPQAQRTSFAYNAAGQPVLAHDPLGHLTTFVRDTHNRVLATINPLGLRSSSTYDANGNRLTATDPLGRRTSFAYSTAGQVTQRIDPLGNRTSYAYDKSGNRARVQDPLGRITTTVYDGANRPVALVDPLGRRTSTAYDTRDNPIRLTDPLGRIVTTVYDAYSRAVARIDALANRTSFTYDSADNLTRLTNPLSAITTTAYDAHNRPTSTTDPLEPANELLIRRGQPPNRGHRPAGQPQLDGIRRRRESHRRDRPAGQPDHHGL